MFKWTRLCLMLAAILDAMTSLAQVTPCPGFNPNKNVNLACEIATAVQISPGAKSQSLGQLSPTLAAQLSQLPLATAVSGSGLTFSKAGTMTASSASSGTILTQRAETLGEHHFYFAFNYQRFGFGSIDGISLKHLDTLNQAQGGTTFVAGHNRIDLMVDQFTAIGSYGLTSHMDVFVLVPFSKVTLKTGSTGAQFDSNGGSFSTVPLFFSGSATGIGDVAVNLKYKVHQWETSAIALGAEVRLPTGDETNYLGTGAYGIKPYFVFSRRGRVTPNVNIGYQWNSTSPLFVNNSGNQLNLPSAILYSGGVDFAVVRKLTMSAEFIGQAVINGPRLIASANSIPHQSGTFQSVRIQNSTYAIDNAGMGLKYSPVKKLFITGDAMFKLDDGGLRAKVLPLVGISYRF